MHIFPSDRRLAVDKLSACFNNTSATYKFYWLLAILDAVQFGNRQIKKRDLFASMIANAWYTVNYFRVSFGRQDLIQDTVKRLNELEGITIDAPKNTIISKLVSSTTPETERLLLHFDKNVPHWFLSPWYPKRDKKDIYRLSQTFAGNPLYQLFTERIVIQNDWFEYLTRHIRIIRDYVFWNLSLFLQVRNPNVPDIANKLIKPAVRSSLFKQRKFWDFIIDKRGPIKCIYTGMMLDKHKYHVEHFIPHSFVAHDQIWNLIPSDPSFNIVKKNRLPSLEKYFEPFYNLQSLAVNTFLLEKPEERLLEDYFFIGTNLNKGLSREKFYEAINPLVTIASNNGFSFLPAGQDGKFL